MEKVKIFSLNVDSKKDFQELEDKINSWFDENGGNKIICRHVTSAAVSGSKFKGESFVNCTVTIFYEEVH